MKVVLTVCAQSPSVSLRQGVSMSKPYLLMDKGFLWMGDIVCFYIIVLILYVSK